MKGNREIKRGRDICSSSTVAQSHVVEHQVGLLKWASHVTASEVGGGVVGQVAPLVVHIVG